MKKIILGLAVLIAAPAAAQTGLSNGGQSGVVQGPSIASPQLQSPSVQTPVPPGGGAVIPPQFPTTTNLPGQPPSVSAPPAPQVQAPAPAP